MQLRVSARAVFALAIGVLIGGSPRPVHAAGGGVVAGHAIPAWARKYNMNCSGCHYPVVPQLNARGLAFKWAGYRMPDEIGKNMEVQKIENYLAARGVARYSYTKPSGRPADTSAMFVPSASVFAAGPVGKHYGAFLEFERKPDASVDLIAQLNAVWGKENAYGGIRAGQGHMIYGGAIAGFDRQIGVLAPLPLDQPNTAGVPYTFTGDLAGVEAFYIVGKRNRTSLAFVDGTLAGGAMGGLSTKNDWVLENQFLWDDNGGGLTALGYYGTIAGLDSLQPGATSHYWRVAATASRYLGGFGLLAGYVRAHDTNLPLGAVFTTRAESGNAYWVSGQYTVPKIYPTFYGRWEYLDPNQAVTSQALRRVTLGSVVPINVPEYLRLNIEYFHDAPEPTGTVPRNGVNAEFQMSF